MCEADFNGTTCGWDLVDQPIKVVQISSTEVAQQTRASVCMCGQPFNAGDVVCLACGADLTGEPAPGVIDVSPTTIEGWEVQRRLEDEESSESFEVLKGETSGVLTLYRNGAEPDTAVQAVLKKLDPDHIPEMLETGRYQDRAFEVSEFIRGTSLHNAAIFKAGSENSFRRIADELGRALSAFSDLGLRHREISPNSILIRSEEPMDLVITHFGSARLSDYDLESVSPLELSRYSAPEAIVGGVSVASDWWSLGVILLEHITSGACFDGINDKAFQIHVVTRGIPIPNQVEGPERDLLRGLLTRDPLKRWKWTEVSEWLEGRIPAIHDEGRRVEVEAGPDVALMGRKFRNPDLYALAGANADAWEESKAQLLKGVLATWLDSVTVGKTIASSVRSISLNDRLDDDEKHALSLMHMNASLPLIFVGEIVSPAWLLKHPDRGYALISGPVSQQLTEMGRERWLTRLSSRLQYVREKAGQLRVTLDEGRLRIAALSTSRANLDAERALLRKLFPEADNEGLASLMEHDRLSDEELLVLITAEHSQFMPLESVVDDAAALAVQYSIGSFSKDAAREQLVLARRDLYQLIDSRITGFARCSLPRIDEWADAFRIERRIALPRAVLILSILQDAWQEPPKQQYISSLLDHFGKKVDQSIQRGPLVRFIVGKTTARVDLLEIGSGVRPAPALLDHLLRRGEAPIGIDPEVFTVREGLLPRLRRLISHAQTFRRETGIDGRYLAFPFLVVRSAATEGEQRAARIAPILLWPVTVEMPSGNMNNATIAFDKSREEVRLNPALSVLLDPEEQERFRKIRDEVLARPSLRSAEVIDLFGRAIPPRGRDLIAVPSKDTRLRSGERQLVCSAAIFNAEFTGQAIAEDLRQLRHIPPSGTALESALRVSPQEAIQASGGPMGERFHVVEADPSQEAAVFKAREKPGLLVEGPPGTGKSQTIVNIVADSIARNETVLVVCQKQVALKVVQKRLEAEGLGGRLVSVVDPQRDRQVIVRGLREQAESLLRAPSNLGESLRRLRRDISSQTAVLERDLNNYHDLLHRGDDLSGLSYRQLLCELIELDTKGPVVAIPALRPTLAKLPAGQVESAQDQCAALSSLWLKSKFEDSPLHVIKSFAADEGVALAHRRTITEFALAESTREESLKRAAFTSEVSDPENFLGWITQHKARFSALLDERWKAISKWIELFKAPAGQLPLAEVACQVVKEVASCVGDMEPVPGDERIRTLNESLTEEALGFWLTCAEIASRKVGFFGKLSWGRYSNRRRLKRWLVDNGSPETPFENYLSLLKRERDLRPHRAKVRSAAKIVRWATLPTLTSENHLIALCDEIAATIDNMRFDANSLLACPALREVEQMISAAAKAAYDQFEGSYEATLAQHLAREASKLSLDALKPIFEEAWIGQRSGAISSNRAGIDDLQIILASLVNLPAFQQFRARATKLPAESLVAFKELRQHDQQLVLLSPDDLANVVSRTFRKEALMAWKSRIEHAQPDLLSERAEIEMKQRKLSELEASLRQKNRELLEKDIDPSDLGNLTKWDAITRLTGARMKRLREVFDEGRGIGLMKMRPVWMMTPDVVSQLLPRTANLFDVVVFDEASQLLVEYAVPSMFRASRAVVSGDDKQMPPTSFFSSRSADEEEELEMSSVDDNASEEERDILEEKWNRREIKDCPDLLALAAGCFPATTLKIHYRSKYRELIAFSNSAFYKGELSVPAKHPEQEIRRARPIKLVRVDGVYQAQTNPEEAQQVVEELAQLWSQGERPSTCVVTFNKKQADLVYEAIEERAASDEAFLNAYNAEKVRTQDGEDMGFIVRNVENVQGDERDVVIFSTTFGRNAQGAFRRTFGALGQKGGERRLNVAVTRARIQVILVTSMPISDVSDMLSSGRKPSKPRDFLQGYLDYSSKVSAGDLEMAQLSATRLHTRSGASTRFIHRDGFVEIVEKYIRSLGVNVNVVRGETGDTFGVDLAVESKNAGHFALAIECDSPVDQAGHLSTARARDVWRPKILKRAIPSVHRVSSHGWYHDGPGERERLERAVHTAMEIKE